MSSQIVPRLDLLSADEPVKSLRLGYPGTGYSFYLTRCLDKKAFVAHVRGTHLDDHQTLEDAPVAKCYLLYGCVLPGTMEEAAVDALCEIHLVVIAQDDLTSERRHWYHEIGHAADFAKQAFPALCARKTYAAGIPHDPAKVAAAQVEVSAYVTEFLSEAIVQALAGPVTFVASGLPLVYDEVFKAADESEAV